MAHRHPTPLDRKKAISDLMAVGLRTKGMGHGDEYDTNRKRIHKLVAPRRVRV